MSAQGTTYLMYHELRCAGRDTCRPESGYTRYVVAQEEFSRQLAWLKQEGIAGRSVGSALQAPGQGGVAFTFDDGCETDLLAAAPLLKEHGFGATFYVVVGFLGQRGYLSQAQAHELADQGFEVGCHSMTHPYLTDVSQSELRVQVADAKQQLEQILGRPVEHFCCPGGRVNGDVRRMAREAGYSSLVTTRPGINTAASDRFDLCRVTILSDTPMDDFQRLCRGQGLWKQRAKTAVLATAKAVLGNTLYEKLRGAALGD